MFNTNIPSIYALGDIIGTPELTPVALAQAMKLLSHWFDGDTTPLSYEDIPTAVFFQFRYGPVGLTEEQALKKLRVEITSFDAHCRGIARVSTGRNMRTYMSIGVQSR